VLLYGMCFDTGPRLTCTRYHEALLAFEWRPHVTPLGWVVP
jgi:hypothetical protein